MHADHAAPDPELSVCLRPHLADDEPVLYATRPAADRLRLRDPRLVMTGIFWVALSGVGFWGFGATALSAEYDGLPLALRAALLALAAAPFIVVGWFTLHGHVGMRRRAAARTIYAVTAVRVVALAPLLWIAGPSRLASIPVADARFEPAPGAEDRREEDRGAEMGVAEIVDQRGVAAPIPVAGLARPDELRDAIEAARPDAAPTSAPRD